MEKKKGRPKKSIDTNIEPKKRGRKIKETNNVKITKKRGRKPEIAYFSSSAAKRAMKEVETAKPVDNCNILQLNIDTTKVMRDMTYKTLETFNNKFKELQFKQNPNNDVVETFLELQKENSQVSLETLYTEKLEKRQKENENILEQCKNFHLNNEHPLLVDYNKENIIDDYITPKSTFIENIQEKIDITLLETLVDKPWNQHTNIKCWWCCHSFQNIPVGLPVKYQENIQKFIVKGIFCSMACMYSYANEKYPLTVCKPLIRHMYKILTGANVSDKITPALPKETLIDFGGELTIEQFRTLSEHKQTYKRIEYPIIVKKDIIHLSEIEHIKESDRKINAGKNGKLAVDYTQPIEKPIQGDTIDAILGLEYE